VPKLPVPGVTVFPVVAPLDIASTAVVHELLKNALLTLQVELVQLDRVGRDQLLQPLEDRPRHRLTRVVAQAVLDDCGQGA
jgi:hypothetical protein